MDVTAAEAAEVTSKVEIRLQSRGHKWHGRRSGTPSNTMWHWSWTPQVYLPNGI